MLIILIINFYETIIKMESAKFYGAALQDMNLDYEILKAFILIILNKI